MGDAGQRARDLDCRPVLGGARLIVAVEARAFSRALTGTTTVLENAGRTYRATRPADSASA